MTPREALDRIAGLCDALDREVAYEEDGLFAGVTYSTAKVRAVLAEVSPEPGGATSDDHQRGYAQGYTEGRAAGGDERGALGGVLDRDQARYLLRFYLGFVHDHEDRLLDRLAGCVVAKRSDDA